MIYSILQEHGMTPLLDEKNISGGEIIEDKISSLLEQSQILIVIISQFSIKSPWVFYEIGRADEAGRTIIPYLTHTGLSTDLPFFLLKRKCFTNLDNLKEFFSRFIALNLPDRYLLSLNLSGLTAAYKSRESIPDYFGHFVKNAAINVRAMFVSGNFFGAVTLENAIKRKPGVCFRILLLNPELSEIRNKDINITEYKIQPSEWNTVLNTLKRLKNASVRLYNEYPFWHLLIVDEIFCVVSFNPLGKLGYNASPVYLFENNKHEGNLFSAFSQYYEIIWRNAEPPDTLEQQRQR